MEKKRRYLALHFWVREGEEPMLTETKKALHERSIAIADTRISCGIY